MEAKREILVVADENGFLPRAIAEQLGEYGYLVTMTELNVQKLYGLRNEFEVVLLYMENKTQGYEQILSYLGDKAIKEGLPVFYIGDDWAGLKTIMPENIIGEIFERPVDVKFSAKKIDEYIKEHGKHAAKKILVVDDSGAILRSLKTWLEDKYEVILANSGERAIKCLAAIRPDLVLLDYEMPVMDGRQVLERMRSEEEFCDIPVTFLTSKNDKDSIMKVMELKPEGYILKTTPPKQLLQEIGAFFARQL